MDSLTFGVSRRTRITVSKAIPVLGVCLLVFLASVPLFSQANAGRIFGSVSDKSGGAIAGATVTVTDMERGTPRALTTDVAGAYNAPSLVPGTYMVRVEYTGFRSVEHTGVVLEVGKELKVDFSLEPGELTQVITVSGEIPMVESANAVLGGTLQPGTIENLPLNGRNFMNLLQLRPGVTIYPGGGAWTQTTNGLRPEHNVYILDGITAMEPFGSQSTINSVSLAGDSASLLPIDTIQEFTTQQNPKAEFGWKPGSITSIALKSGTNAWHGTANAFGRTDATDARNPFLEVDQKQHIGLQEFGATFGGPIKKDKVFFFTSYEGQRYEVGNPTELTFPSLDRNALPRAGRTTSLVQACNTVRNAGTPLSPTSLKIAGLDANCNRTSGYSIFDLPSFFQRAPDANGAAGAIVAGSMDTQYAVDGGLAKVDLHFGDKNTFNGKYFVGTHRGLVVNNQTITQPYWRPTDVAWVHFAGAQWDHIVSSAMVNTFRFGYNRFFQWFETSDCDQDYGIPFGYGTAKPNCGFTNITLTGFTGSIGCCPSFPKYYGPDNIFEFIDNVSYLRGRHTFKMGGELRNTVIGRGGTFNRGRGQVTFSTLENFLSGTTTAAGQIFIGDPRRHISSQAFAGFFQDDWRIKPGLMLNLGLRYEYVTPIKELHNQLANFDPVQGLRQLGKNLDQVWNPDRNNFAPRAGFAWDVRGNGRTVVRGGANIIYVNPGWWIFLSQQNTNNPTTGLNTNPSGFQLCRGAINTTGPGCAPGVATDPTVGDIRSAGLPLPPATVVGGAQQPAPGQLNWNQNPAAYGGNIYPGSSDTSVLKCGTNRLCTAQATNPNVRNAYVFSWSLGVQHGITRNISLEVGYVGNHATKLLGLEYTNTPPLGAGYCFGFTAEQIARVAATSPSTPCPTTITTSTPTNATAIQLSRPLNDRFPYFSYIYTVSNPFHSNYNGAQMTLTQRNIHGLAYTIGFTFSHALDQSPGERTGGGGGNDSGGTPGNFRADYGNSGFDIRKRLTATLTYALPGRKGFLQMLEGWKVTSIVSIQSALPWGVIGSRGQDPSGIAEFQERWNLRGKPKDFSGLKTDSVPFFLPGTTPPAGRSASDLAINNPACTAVAGPPGSLGYVSLQKWGCFAKGRSVMVPPAIGSYGSMGRNIFRGNGMHVWDASVIKDWKFTEKFTGQFRVEVFNFLNQTQYGNPQFNGAGANAPFGEPGEFGASQATPDVSNNNPSLGSGGPREFQFGFKIIF